MSTKSSGSVDSDTLCQPDLHREHSLDVPAHCHQIPFAFDVLEAPQQALPISHHPGLIMPNTGSGAQRVELELLPSRGLQSMRHLCSGVARVGRGFGCCGKTLFPADMMATASQGNQRLDLDRGNRDSTASGAIGFVR
jgi:hypothetical protein